MAPRARLPRRGGGGDDRGDARRRTARRRRHPGGRDPRLPLLPHRGGELCGGRGARRRPARPRGARRHRRQLGEGDARRRARLRPARPGADQPGDPGTEAPFLPPRGDPRPGVHHRRARPALRRGARGRLRHRRRRHLAARRARDPPADPGEPRRAQAGRGGALLAEEHERELLRADLEQPGRRPEPELRVQMGLLRRFEHEPLRRHLPRRRSRLRTGDDGDPGVHAHDLPRPARTAALRSGAGRRDRSLHRPAQLQRARPLALGIHSFGGARPTAPPCRRSAGSSPGSTATSPTSRSASTRPTARPTISPTATSGSPPTPSSSEPPSSSRARSSSRRSCPTTCQRCATRRRSPAPRT